MKNGAKKIHDYELTFDYTETPEFIDYCDRLAGIVGQAEGDVTYFYLSKRLPNDKGWMEAAINSCLEQGLIRVSPRSGVNRTIFLSGGVEIVPDAGGQYDASKVFNQNKRAGTLPPFAKYL